MQAETRKRADPVAVVIKWLLRAAGALVVLALLALLAGYMLLSRSLPDYDKRLAVRGLDAPMEIVRDTANVPHVFGEPTPTRSSASAMPMRRTGSGR